MFCGLPSWAIGLHSHFNPMLHRYVRLFNVLWGGLGELESHKRKLNKYNTI